MRKGVNVGRKAISGAVGLAVVAVVTVAAVLGHPAVGVAGLFVLVVLAFGLYVGAWASNSLAWRREADPRPAAGVGLELGS
jgi:hypothetical protein